jgi:prolyl-tRNA editing enzyme YbaK/EbsC (Cys-tRNA(Pro) deacylase)
MGLDDLLHARDVHCALLPTYLRAPQGQGARGRIPITGAHRIATGLLLADRLGSAVAVIPKDRALDLGAMQQEFGRQFHVLGRIDASRAGSGPASAADGSTPTPAGIELFVDQSLVLLSYVYLETADPNRLARLDGDSFRSLFYGAWCGRITRNPD